jgi:4-hydroxybenzoyl-CoA thioesterase
MMTIRMTATSDVRLHEISQTDRIIMKSKLVVSVEFGETDPAAIVFYPNFFRWFDASAWRLFAKAGLTFDVLREEFGLVGAPIVDVQSTFIKPLRFEDTIEITSYVRSWKRKTFELAHEVRKDGELCAKGVEVRVCAQRLEDGSGEIRAIPIPEEIRRRLSSADQKIRG